MANRGGGAETREYFCICMSEIIRVAESRVAGHQGIITNECDIHLSRIP